jgi:hypothetical protein
MAASTDVKPSTLSPFLILSAPDLQMPLFQRKYGWGGNGLEFSALDYATQFLVNPDANTYFGRLFVYSAEPFDFRVGADTTVFVGDGQHRLVTLVLFATAMSDRIEAILDTDLPDAARARLENYLQDDYLEILRTTSLRVVLDDAGETPKVHDHLRDCKKRHQQLTSRIAELRAKPEKAGERLDADARKERQAARQAELSALTAQLRELQQDCVFASYLALLDLIPAENSSEFTHVAMPFFTRMKDFSANLVHLFSKHGLPTPDDALEGEAYNLFHQLNTHNTPLTTGDLFKSYVSTKGATSPLKAYTDPKDKRRVFLRKLGLVDYTDIVEFFATYLSPGKSVDAHTWLKTKMFGNPNSRAVLQSMHGALSQLTSFETDLSRAEPRIASLYELYFASVRTPRAVAIAQVYAGKKEGETVRLEDLLRLLVLMELMPLYTPSTNKRARGRDMHALKGDALLTGLATVMRHFEATSFDELTERLKATIAKKPFGLAAYRKLGKLLLILSDYRNPGSDVSVQSWKNYNYEHLVPLKIDGALKPDDLPQDARDALADLAEQAPAQRDAALNRLGNAALLASRENKRLGNKSPWAKLNETRTSRLDNAWWPTHKTFLESTAGVMGQSQIEVRSERLADAVADFLLSFDANTVDAAEGLAGRTPACTAVPAAAAAPAAAAPAAAVPQVPAAPGTDIPAELLSMAPTIVTPAGTVAPEPAADEAQPEDEAARRRAPNTELVVQTRRGTLRGKSAVATFVAAIEAAGLANVAGLNLELNGEPLIATSLSAKYASQSKQVGDVFINAQSSNKKKVELLTAISERLNLGWTVDQLVKGAQA